MLIVLSTLSLFSPAKINLMLAVTGRREDGFHNLVSVVAPLAWGDTLHVSASEGFALSCDDPAVPVDESNLVIRAAKAFCAATAGRGGAHFRLEKRIPMGAGLGGGSSNAAATLRALNQLAGEPLDHQALGKLAASLGADCPLFLEGAPVIMRGRGETIETLTEVERARLRGRRVLIFKPGFGVPTPWAYGRMVANPDSYMAPEKAEAHLARWRKDDQRDVGDLLCNNMEAAVYAKYPALPALHQILEEQFGLKARMSGSGSASFVFPDVGTDLSAVETCIRDAWGADALILATSLA